MTNRLIEFFPYLKKGIQGIDIIINNEKATVADYYEALDDYILAGTYERQRFSVSSCEGCDGCCHERIPLTALDVQKLMNSLPTKESLESFLQKYAHVYVEGPTVDITLGRRTDESCIFLDKERKKCLSYQHRPLVCHSYICTPSSPRLAKLRETIINTGEDELVRLWLENEEENLVIHEAWEPALDPTDWSEGPWSGKANYGEVLIRDLVPPSLWESLRKR